MMLIQAPLEKGASLAVFCYFRRFLFQLKGNTINEESSPCIFHRYLRKATFLYRVLSFDKFYLNSELWKKQSNLVTVNLIYLSNSNVVPAL